MAVASLKPGVRKNYLVRRYIPLCAAVSEAKLAQLFDDLVGYNSVQVTGCRMLLEYDASSLHLDRLLTRLSESGVEVKQGGVTRFRLGWYRYLDRNIADNAKNTSSTACSQSPLRFR